MPRTAEMRIAVTGASGAGKTTLAHTIATHLTIPHIELDAINWQSGWRDLARHDPDEFIRRVTGAIEASDWVVDGNYSPVHDTVWQRATHLVWLDYDRPVIMCRVIGRTLLQVALRTELWAGNRERWRHLLRPSHPVRRAWSTGRRPRHETEQRLARGDCAHLRVLLRRRPSEADGAIEPLARTSDSAVPGEGAGGHGPPPKPGL